MIHERSDLDSDSFSEQANHDGWNIGKWKLNHTIPYLTHSRMEVSYKVPLLFVS